MKRALLLVLALLGGCDAQQPPASGRRPPTLAGPDWGSTAAPATGTAWLPPGFRGGEVVLAEHARLGLVSLTITSPPAADPAALQAATRSLLAARFGSPGRDEGGTTSWPAAQAGGALVQLDTTPDRRVRIRQSLTQSADHVTERKLSLP